MLNFSWKDFAENLLKDKNEPQQNEKGEYSYFVEVSAKGEVQYQTCVLSVNAFTKSDKQIAIATKYKWYRVNGERVYTLRNILSNTYQVTALDVGCILKVEVIPLEDDHKGIATATIGPIKIDPSTRVTLEGILAAGGTKFPIEIEQEYSQEKETKQSSTIMISNENIRIIRYQGGIEKESVLKFRYTLSSPYIELSHVDGLKMIFEFSSNDENFESVKHFMGGNQQQISVNFMSKISRDLFILALRCFIAKQNYVDSKIISDNFFGGGKLFGDKNSNNGAGINGIGDFLLEIDTIKRELYTMVDRNRILLKESEQHRKCIKRLEDELQQTMESYNKIIDDLKKSNKTGSNNSSLQDEIKKLLQKQDVVESEKKTLKHKLELYEKNGNTDVRKGNIEDLIKQNEQLKNELRSMKLQSQQSDQIGRLQQENEYLQQEIVMIRENDQKLLQMKEDIHKQNMQGFVETIDSLKNINDKLRREWSQSKSRVDELEALLRRKGGIYQSSDSGEDSQKLKNLEKSLINLRQQNQALAIEAATFKVRSDNFQKELQVLNGEGAGTSFRLDYEMMKDNINELESKVQQYSRKNQLLELELSNCKMKCASLEMGGKTVDSTISNLLETKINLEKQMLELQSQLSDNNTQQEQQNEVQSGEKNNLEQNIQELQKKCETLAKENDKLKSDLIKLKTKSNASSTITKECEELKRKNKELEKELEKISQGLKQNGDDNEVGREVELLKQQKTQMQKKVESLQKELENKMRDQEKLRNEKQGLQDEVEALQQQMKQFRVNDIADMDSSQSFTTSMYLGHRMNLRDKVAALETDLENKNKELEATNLEKDKLLVEISRLFAQRKAGK